jgi:PAS domain S-box-containing protein
MQKTQRIGSLRALIRSRTRRSQAARDRGLRVEEKLRVTETTYRSMFENAVEGLIRKTPSGDIIGVNPAAVRMHGFLSPEEFLAEIHSTEQLYAHPERRVDPLRALQDEDVVRDLEVETGRKQGDTIPVSMNCAVRDEAGDLVCLEASLFDVTARKQAEAALRASERRFRALLENSPVSIALIDADATLRYVSPEALRVTDSEGEHVSGTNAFDWLHPDDLQEGLRAFTEVLEQPGKVVTLQVRAVTQTGSYRWIEAVVKNLLDDPDVAAVVVNAHDVTERRQVQQELIEREARLQLLLEQVPATLWTTDRDLRVTLAVGSGYSSVMRDPKELLGRTVTDVLGELRDPGPVVKGLRRALAGGVATYGGEWRGRTWRSHVEPLRDAEGTICGTIGVSLDVTESTVAAEQLERSIGALRKIDQERRELISRLVSAQEDERIRVARELHDHIGQLLASASFLAKSVEEAAADTPLEEPLGFLSQLLEQAQVATRSVMASIRAVDLDEGGLHAAIAHLAEEVRQRHDIDVDLHLAGLDGRLSKEREIAVFRIIQEALINAINHASPKVISVVGTVQEEKVLLLVEDDGCGFSFEDVVKGPLAARLGILGMQERATAVGGDISVESRPGSGSTVRLRMPVGAGG